MKFVRDDLHQFEELSVGTEYHVTCKDGFMFKDGVDSALVSENPFDFFSRNLANRPSFRPRNDPL